ncbi:MULTISPECIES: MFS transporter [unclassified Nonomuraea]|uniref:MFS transporter n=1 Tax=unclassified Nonomuraea TaxID=2593643 RepID=UPI0033F6B215
MSRSSARDWPRACSAPCSSRRASASCCASSRARSSAASSGCSRRSWPSARSAARGGNPLLEPSLFRNRGFIAGVLVGALFFAAVSGLLYVSSLYLQDGQRLEPLTTAGTMAPLSVGIIVASFSARGLITRLGRRLVAIGLALTGAGVLCYLAVVAAPGLSTWVLTAPLLVCGLGMGCCFGSIFAVALGDVGVDESGSASGALNAVQQLANAFGAAGVSTVFLTVSTGQDARSDALLTLCGVLGAIVLCALCLPLLPKAAAAGHH